MRLQFVILNLQPELKSTNSYMPNWSRLFYQLLPRMFPNLHGYAVYVQVFALDQLTYRHILLLNL